MSRLQHFIAYVLRSNCAKYEVCSLIGLRDMIKIIFCNVGGATYMSKTYFDHTFKTIKVRDLIFGMGTP